MGLSRDQVNLLEVLIAEVGSMDCVFCDNLVLWSGGLCWLLWRGYGLCCSLEGQKRNEEELECNLECNLCVFQAQFLVNFSSLVFQSAA